MLENLRIKILISFQVKQTTLNCPSAIYCHALSNHHGKVSFPLEELLLSKLLCSPSEGVKGTQALPRARAPRQRGRITVNGVCCVRGSELLREQTRHTKSKSAAAPADDGTKDRKMQTFTHTLSLLSLSSFCLLLTSSQLHHIAIMLADAPDYTFDQAETRMQWNEPVLRLIRAGSPPNQPDLPTVWVLLYNRAELI